MDAPVTAENLNASCFCLPVEGTPKLASTHPLFLDRAVRAQLLGAVAAIAGALDELRPASRDHAAGGLFNSFDFHLPADGPKLIEININAGGAFLQRFIRPSAAALQRHECCSGRLEPEFDPVDAMLECWRRLRGEQALLTIAIVDTDPEGQGLYDDMLAARTAIRARGIGCDILDISALRLQDGRLAGPAGPIDFVYNRCTDFSLSHPDNAVLRHAWRSGAALVAPNPDIHAAYADKHWLIALSDLARQGATGLDCILETRELTAANAAQLWARRRDFVFKPRQGYGSRGVYRGDKLTSVRWPLLLDQGYLAQAYAEPMPRTMPTSAGVRRFKSDIRIWTLGTEPLHMAARLYSGQVMGMKREAEGFAPIVWIEPGAGKLA
jgi:hypothetical protein